MREKSSALRAKEAFMALYHDGKFKPGTKIPSESNMAELLGVSRETWRKALALLRGDGVLYSKHGSGTYLLEQSHHITNDLSQLKSMSRMIEEAGLVEEGSCMTCTVGAAPEEVCKFFEVPAGTDFLTMQHIRRTVEGVIVVSLGYLPGKYADLMKEHMPHSLFDFLEETEGIHISHATTELFIPSKTDPMYELLHLADDQSAFGFKQGHYDSRGNPILYSLDYLRSDLFHFTIMRIRP